jgi:hypothetical protein
MTVKITHKDEFRVRSDSGKTRIIVCAEDHVERGGQGASQKYYAPSGIKSYKFKSGEAAIKVGDSFLDCSGKAYQRIT